MFPAGTATPVGAGTLFGLVIQIKNTRGYLEMCAWLSEHFSRPTPNEADRLWGEGVFRFSTAPKRVFL